MPRKKPFSGKQKKQQLKDKKNRKQDGPRYLRKTRDSDEDSSEDDATTAADKTSDAGKFDDADAEIQKINHQPLRDTSSKQDINSFRLHFFKESDEVVERRKREARKPLKCVSQEQLMVKLEDVYPANALLDFPTRPPWSYSLSKEQLEKQEFEYFKDYLSHVLGQPRSQDLSYLELNLETWRQLWRVLEISDILLIIADIRCPVLHVPPSLLTHVLKELGKQVIIILNKVDFVPASLALAWKQYLQDKFPGIHVVFFSSYPRVAPDKDAVVSFDPSEALYKRAFRSHAVPVGPPQLLAVCKTIVQSKVNLSSWEKKLSGGGDVFENRYQDHRSGDGDEGGASRISQSGDSSCSGDRQDPSHRQMSQQPLDSTFSTYTRYKDGIVTIGLIGYPNVGKSSVLNALVGKKVVSVSKTPGHTKHLQTIFLSPTVRLCDCPGLVFPSMVPKSLQIVAGIFPVAQVREPYSVVTYVAKRLDLPKLLKLHPPSWTPRDHGGDVQDYVWSAFDICEAWAIKNGYTTAKAGRPDVSRAANSILRLAVDGQLCLCFRPPGYPQWSEQATSRPETQQLADLLTRTPKHSPPSSAAGEEEEEEGEADDDADVSDDYADAVSASQETNKIFTGSKGKSLSARLQDLGTDSLHPDDP